MSDGVKPPPPWLVRFNVWALRRGLKMGSQYLLTIPGRKTGLPRSTPVSIVLVDGARYLVAAFSDADWVKNGRAAGAGHLARGRQVEEIRLAELAPEDRAPVLRQFLRQVRGGARFFESSDPEVVAASAARYPVFRID